MKNRYQVGTKFDITAPVFDTGEEGEVLKEVIRRMKNGVKAKDIVVSDALLGRTYGKIDIEMVRARLKLDRELRPIHAPKNGGTKQWLEH